MLLMFGDKASIMFSHLVNFAEMHADAEGWFFFTQQQITDKVGYLRTQTEAALKTLNDAGLIEIGHRPSDPRRYFRISVTVEQLAEILSKREKKIQSAQTPARAPKTAPRPKQAANTAKETPNQSERPLEMVEPVGKTEQLPAEKPKKPKANTAEIDAAAVRLIEHLNTVAGRNFRPVAANINNIARVLRSKEGTEDDVRLVIDFKTSRWGNDPHMRDSLNPETLCRPSKFARYLDEANAAKNQHVSGQRAPSYVVAQDNNLTIELPNGQRFGDYFDRKDQRKVDMIQAQMIAHPGIEKFLPPQLAFKQYLASINDSELQHHLKEARREWRYANYTPPDPNQLPF